MATTGRMNGDVLLLTLEGTAISYSTNATLNLEQELLDASSKDSARWNEHVRGNRGWSIDVEGLVDYAASYGAEELALLITTGASATAVFSTGVSGDVKYTGTVDLSSLTMDAPHNGVVTFSGSLQGTGAPTVGTV